jgi:uncharacterized protein YdaU (DUF1376 family)
MNKPPAFQFYADDFLAGTFDMTTAEVGAYIRLLCHQWNRGSIPVEPEKQQRLAGGSVSDDVRSKFKRGKDGLMRNERMELERQKLDAYREQQRKKGILSGQIRRTVVEQRLNNGSIPVEPTLEPEGNSPVSRLQSPIGNNNNKAPSLEEVKTHAQFIGQSPQDAELFWHHFESTGWIDKNGHAVVSWKSKQQTWKTQSQSLAGPVNGHKKTGVSESANAVIRAEEYKRVCAEIVRIQTNGAQDALGTKMYTLKERADLERLRKRREALRTELGVTL